MPRPRSWSPKRPTARTTSRAERTSCWVRWPRSTRTARWCRGRHALDAGASTGGFTEVLLRRGAAHVIAVDVGYGQLAWSLQQDPRVTVMDRTNIRDTRHHATCPTGRTWSCPTCPSSPCAWSCPTLAALATPDADLVLMVKPQFEVGREALAAQGSGGVVRDPGLRASAVLDVARIGARGRLGHRGRGAKPVARAERQRRVLSSPAGRCRRRRIRTAVERAVREGPH